MSFIFDIINRFVVECYNIMANPFELGWPIIINILLVLLALAGILYILYICSKVAERKVVRKPTLQLN